MVRARGHDFLYIRWTAFGEDPRAPLEKCLESAWRHDGPVPARRVSRIPKRVRYAFGQKDHAAGRRLLPLSADVHLNIPGVHDEDLMVVVVYMRRRPTPRRRDDQAKGEVIPSLPTDELEHDRIPKSGDLVSFSWMNDNWLHGESLAHDPMGWLLLRLASPVADPSRSKLSRYRELSAALKVGRHAPEDGAGS